MHRRARIAILIHGLVLLLMSGITPTRADLVATVSVVIAPEPDGMAMYTYTIAVTPTAVDPASTSSVSEFDLSLTSGTTSGINTPVGAILSSIMMQTGFINLYTPGDPTISFYSTDVFNRHRAGVDGDLFLRQHRQPDHAALLAEHLRREREHALRLGPRPLVRPRALELGAVRPRRLGMDGLGGSRPVAKARSLRRLDEARSIR